MYCQQNFHEIQFIAAFDLLSNTEIQFIAAFDLLSNTEGVMKVAFICLLQEFLHRRNTFISMATSENNKVRK